MILLLPALLLAVYFRREIKQEFYYPMDYRAQVSEHVEAGVVPLALLMAVIRTESGFDPEAVSGVGARGLTQMMPETFRWLQGKTGEELPLDALFDPDVSIRYGALLLDYLIKEFGEVEVVLAAYHAGRGRVNEWLRDPDISPDGVTIPRIPVPATRHYVRKVMKAYEKYAELCG